MGNIFSNEEKLLQPQKNQVILERNSKKIYRIYEQYGNHQANHLYIRQNEHKHRRSLCSKRNIYFHGRYSQNEYLKNKSHSLNAILEELYTFGPEDYVEDCETKIRFETGGSLIPRIKLKRSTSSLKEEKSYDDSYNKMSSESEIILGINSTNPSINSILKKESNDNSRSESNITILLNDQTYDEISSKSDENYFTKNFDDCMKRLQQIEKEHELIENEDKDVDYFVLQKENENIQTDVPEQMLNYKSEYEFKNCENASTEEKKLLLERPSKILGNNEKLETLKQNSMPAETVETSEITEHRAENKQQAPTNWYSNLKQQFEKIESEAQETKTKEMSCRITGATLKNNQIEKIKSKDNEENTKHYFSRLMKTNKSLIDEELPDPDKVKHIRAMFQETLNSTLKKKLENKIGGSLQNISFRATEQQMNRPLSAQCYRNDIICEGRNNQKSNNEKDKTLKENSRSLDGGNDEFQSEKAKKKLFEKYEKESKPGRDGRSKRILQSKWTDTGSVSSGISSDLSSYDTDLESYSREGTEQDELIISDEDILDEMKDKHYVQNEVLDKIRSFGTSVTYYGGEMITCSVGPLLSPTTQAIMEEINEKYGPKTTPNRSFDEFYRKYIEANEPNRMKKIGRTRSFGQNDVFQKPNILNNTEIELYKNDLELEIGIKKPLGIPQSSFKKKVTKSASLDSKAEKIEKSKENYMEVLICTSDSTTAKETSEKDLVAECDAINKNVMTEILVAANSKEETKLEKETENHFNISNKKEIKYEGDAAKEEAPKTVFEEDRYFSRSKSAPEGFSGHKSISNQLEIVSKNIENPAEEIFFSYEKSIFNRKRNSDMEFEEFEVCESLTEKLEKLEKINFLEKSIISKETLEVSSSSSSEVESQVKNLSEATSDGELQKRFENNSDEEIKLNLTKAGEEIFETKEIQGIKEDEEELGTSIKSEKKESKYNCTKWPIKTSVMVDIQKSSEQTPKLISSGKTVAKTKIRLF